MDRVVVWLGRGGFCRRNRIRLSNMTHALFQVFTVLLPRSALSLGLKKFGTTNTTKKRFQTAPRVAPAVCVLGVLQTLPGLPCVRLLLLLLLLVSSFSSSVFEDLYVQCPVQLQLRWQRCWAVALGQAGSTVICASWAASRATSCAAVHGALRSLAISFNRTS